MASVDEAQRSTGPLWLSGRPDLPQEKERLAEAARRERLAVVAQIERQFRAQAIQAVYADPDRYEAERIWQAYNRAVAHIAWRQGDKEPQFVAKFTEPIQARTDAESEGDDAGIRLLDAQLLRLTGVPFPRLPQAAWDAADTLPDSERELEYQRLTLKYGPRTAPIGNGKGRRQRGAALSVVPALNLVGS